MDPTNLHILILAAGASRRMRGRDKLLEPVRGVPLLRHLATEALATGLPVTVVLPPDRPERIAVLHGLSVNKVMATQAASGLSASLIAGIASIPQDQAVMILLADLPEIDRIDLQRMATAQATAPDAILRGTAEDGTPGHPVLLPPWARAELEGLSGDEGARPLLKTHADRVRSVALPARHATTDLDTPEDWAVWRAGLASDKGRPQ